MSFVERKHLLWPFLIIMILLLVIVLLFFQGLREIFLEIGGWENEDDNNNPDVNLPDKEIIPIDKPFYLPTDVGGGAGESSEGGASASSGDEGGEVVILEGCYDSDDGDNIFQKGSVAIYDHGILINDPETATDSCIPATLSSGVKIDALTEWFCGQVDEETQPVSGIYDCLCEDGKCTNKVGCFDSDEGDNPYENGSTLIFSNGLIIENELDHCDFDTGPFVMEFYCDDSGIKTSKHSCYECNSGKIPLDC